MSRVFRSVLLLALAALPLIGAAQGVRIKDLARIDGMRENMIVGYGIVSGLAGTGDSARGQATLQSVANALREFGVVVAPGQINSRNVAAVLVTATLPAYARPGDKLDVNVSSLGDARSLFGGTLLMTPLYGPNRKVYALAQGSLSVGGYKYDMYGNVVQKNHPTAGLITEGGIIEAEVTARVLQDDGTLRVLLNQPDYTTASRIAQGINDSQRAPIARAAGADRVEITVPTEQRGRVVDFVASIERIAVNPDLQARVVVSERTGTVVSGGDVRLSGVTVTQGDLRVSIVTDYLVSQPDAAGIFVRQGPGVRTQVVPSTRIDAKEGAMNSVALPDGATVSDLVSALKQIKTSTRDLIAILQSIKRAGALHAELVIQ